MDDDYAERDRQDYLRAEEEKALWHSGAGLQFIKLAFHAARFDGAPEPDLNELPYELVEAWKAIEARQAFTDSLDSDQVPQASKYDLNLFG